jgi:transposase
MSVPGIGALGATAVVAAVGDGRSFGRARDFAAWLGLVPRQHTTGGKARLGAISKCGDAYLRRNFVHGARAALRPLIASGGAVGAWAERLLARSHVNVAVVALANKLARVAWAVLVRGPGFEARAASAAG